MPLLVRTELIGTKLYRLRIFIDGAYIGEYERSQAADIPRKRAEITAAQPDLLALYRRHGELCVRWNGKDREKTVRRSDGVKVGVIPKEAWRTPSWRER
jgi:hypothetical protein